MYLKIISRILIISFVYLSFHSPLYSANIEGIDSLRQTSKAFSRVAKEVSPSVVFIQVESVKKGMSQSPIQTPFGDDMFRRFFGDQFPRDSFRAPPKEQRVMGQGSGFVFKTNKGMLSNSSYIMTNNHVVQNADKIRVTFQDGREFDATLKGADPKSDIAVLEIKGADRAALPLGNSDTLEVGEWVIAVGNPFGLSHTLTVGVVSAKGRSGLGINDYEDFIQTDAAINPGNSGGPLLNLNGEVIGINTAIFSKSGGYMGVGFAIPVKLALNIADQLIDKGDVTRGYLGIVIQDLTPELAESFGTKDVKGILVAQVSEGSPAEKAGIKVGDLIIEYQGEPAKKVADFRNQVALTQPGKNASIRIIRNGKKLILSVKIGSQEKGPILASGSMESSEELGFAVKNVTADIARQYDVTPGEGVFVTGVRPNSVANMAGIRQGTIILRVNRKPVNSADEFKREVAKYLSKKSVLLLLGDKGMQRYVVLNW